MVLISFVRISLGVNMKFNHSISISISINFRTDNFYMSDQSFKSVAMGFLRQASMSRLKALGRWNGARLGRVLKAGTPSRLDSSQQKSICVTAASLL